MLVGHTNMISLQTDLNGVESYVHEKAMMNDVSFFPISRSMRLDVMGGHLSRCGNG